MKITCSKRNYGGAFDIDPEMFFTRDDLDELNEAVLDRISETVSGNYRISDSYIDGKDNQNVHIEVDDVEAGVTHFADAHIDMRKIRKGSDLRDKYAVGLASQIIEAIKEYGDVYSSESIIEGGRDLPGLGDYNPPDYDEPEEGETIEYINVQIDADIVLAEDGSWEYEDEDFPWACPNDRSSDWYSEEYPDVYLDDCTGVVEKVDELMEDKLPSKPGRYHVSGNVNLYYSIIDIDIYSENEGVDEDGDPIINETIDTSNADVYHVSEKDTLEDFECTLIDVNASTNISAGVTFSEPKSSKSQRYGMYTSAQYKGVNFSIHYNEIDTSPEADPTEMLNTFRAQVSESHPYDDGEYLSAVLESGTISYRVSGKRPIKQSYYLNADDMDVENVDWCDAIIEQAIIELRELNKSVKAKMVHN